MTLTRWRLGIKFSSDHDRDARHAAAGDYYRRSIEVAHEQDALSFELRAALGLGELLKLQGRDVEARELVSGLHAQFTEGFETPDLLAADRLLGELASASHSTLSGSSE